MIKNVEVFPSSEGNVWKYVFEFDGKPAVAEAVLYRYVSFEKRTVLCISVQSGCPVGCTFCGTGGYFLRNLSKEEIVEQVDHVFKDKGIDPTKIEKLQIMFMSMGEPFMNYIELEKAIIQLEDSYPIAQFLISTTAPASIKRHFADFVALSKFVPTVGLQFSIHKSNDAERNHLIPLRAKLSLAELRDVGIEWWHQTGRKPYCNYCIDGTNNTDVDFHELRKLFPPNIFCFTFSVVCSPDATMKDAGYRNLDAIRAFEQRFIDEGYNTRVFDPAGQDDIGGGCGQLWYVQDYFKQLAASK